MDNSATDGQQAGSPLGLGLSELLGPLPEAAHRGPTGTGAYFDAYTAAQMRAYAAEQVAAERAKCAAIVRLWGETHEPHETVNARNATSKIARVIEGPNARLSGRQQP